MLITNGVRIAQDAEFCSELAMLGSTFEVYLQYDSARKDVLEHLRGQDCRGIREGALFNLKQYHVSATLVCVVKKGFNDDEVAKIVRDAVLEPHIRGVTFQPIRASGRHVTFSVRDHWVTLSEVRSRLIRDLGLPENALLPHPRNPENTCIGYFSRHLRACTEERLAVASSSFNRPIPLYFGKTIGDSATADGFRVAIISFLDQFNFTVRQSAQGGIMFLTAEGNLVSLDKRFLPGPASRLQVIGVNRREDGVP